MFAGLARRTVQGQQKWLPVSHFNMANRLYSLALLTCQGHAMNGMSSGGMVTKGRIIS